MNETLPQWQRRLTAPDLKGRDLHELGSSTRHMDTCEGSVMPREARVAEAVSDVRPSAQPVRGHLPPVREPRSTTFHNEAAYEGLADNLSLEPTLSDLSLALINGPRADEYAPPELNLPRIGAAWAAVLGLPEAIPGWRVALMMAAMKVVRAGHKPGDDSLVDAAGYLELARRLR